MNILKLLPFLDEASIKELAQSIIKGEIKTETLNVAAILPFLEDDDVELILMHAIEHHLEINPMAVIPFASEATLDRLVEKIQADELKGVDLESIAPFLNEKQIRAMFQKEFENLKQKK